MIVIQAYSLIPSHNISPMMHPVLVDNSLINWFHHIYIVLALARVCYLI